MLKFSSLLLYPVQFRQIRVSISQLLFIQQILDDTHHVSGIILGAGDRVVQKTKMIFALL